MNLHFRGNVLPWLAGKGEDVLTLDRLATTEAHFHVVTAPEMEIVDRRKEAVRLLEGYDKPGFNTPIEELIRFYYQPAHVTVYRDPANPTHAKVILQDPRPFPLAWPASFYRLWIAANVGREDVDLRTNGAAPIIKDLGNGRYAMIRVYRRSRKMS